MLNLASYQKSHNHEGYMQTLYSIYYVRSHKKMFNAF